MTDFSDFLKPLSEKKLAKKSYSDEITGESYYTIDPFYDVNFYNSCKQALKNNKVQFTEYMSIIAPYHWYLKLPHKPMLLNFKELSIPERRFLVSLVKPLQPNDEYRYFRRKGDFDKFCGKFAYNDAYKDCEKTGFGCFFTVNSENEFKEISKKLKNIKIWYLGKYLKMRYKVCLCSSKDIMLIVPRERILGKYEKGKNTLERTEADLNYVHFKLQDRIEKMSLTPYCLNGLFVKPKFVQDPQKFIHF